MLKIIRNNSFLGFLIAILTFIISMTGFLMKFIDSPIKIGYFTLQSALLVSLSSLLYIFNYSGRGYKVFKILSTISMFNIFVTMLVGNTLLLSFGIDLSTALLHIVSPLLYLILYFFFIEDYVKIKHFYILLIYSVVYLIIFVIINIVSGFAIYPFMDVVSNSTNIYLLIGMGGLFVVISLVLLIIKDKIERYINETA